MFLLSIGWSRVLTEYISTLLTFIYENSGVLESFIIILRYIIDFVRNTSIIMYFALVPHDVMHEIGRSATLAHGRRKG